MASYEDRYWTAADGVRLHARDYAGDPTRLPLLCLPGLTRNARDYAALAERHAPRRRVVAVDLRGRGESGYAKDPMSYVPATYVADVALLLTEIALERFVAVGTSIGGLVAMLLAAGGAPVAGAVINDVAPEIDAAGLQRIRGAVGRPSSCPTWLHAARSLAESHRDVHPGWTLEEWLAMAKRLYRINGAGRIVPDYDPRIVEPFRAGEEAAGLDLWEALTALAPMPVAIIRGERSEVLSAATATRMSERLDLAEETVVPGTGHSPTLAEPAAAAAVDRLIARVEEPRAG